MTWNVALAFGFGLLIGSFVNVLVHRLPRMLLEEHVERFDLFWPTSHCPQCHTPLKPWHNIPVASFLWLKGHCSFCKQPIDKRYLVVELTTGLIWALDVWYWGFTPQSVCWASFSTLLLALSIIDWETTLLPDKLTQTLVWTGLMSSAAGWLTLDVHQSIWGAVAGYASLWTVATIFQAITGKQGMGAGDFKLLAGLGAWLGPIALIPLVTLASFGGAGVGSFLKFKGKLRDHGYMPFGPFLALAGMSISAIGIEPIARWMEW